MAVLCANFTRHMKPLVCSVQLQPCKNCLFVFMSTRVVTNEYLIICAVLTELQFAHVTVILLPVNYRIRYKLGLLTYLVVTGHCLAASSVS